MIEDKLDMPEPDFHCPECGGSYFGASGDELTKYNCHDQFNQGCRWSGDDSKCFPIPQIWKDFDEEHRTKMAELRTEIERLRDALRRVSQSSPSQAWSIADRALTYGD